MGFTSKNAVPFVLVIIFLTVKISIDYIKSKPIRRLTNKIELINVAVFKGGGGNSLYF